MISTALAYLELLAREAPTVEFEGPVLEARAVGASVEVVNELTDARSLALRVRALLERRRRREAELSALFDTASDLALLHDLDAVLEAIVRRARTLLDTDVAYMTLHDEQRGDTFMRVTEGTVSARFPRLRLPMGTGLGGLVAQTATPYATDDYGADSRFQHSTEIDAAVGDEGIVAILGVPMRLGARIVGVLFAANRSARPFTRDDVSLLSSFAAHAAVAIDNARLLTETRRAVAELSAANRLSREHGEAIERAVNAHDRLAELVLRGGDIVDLARGVADLLNGALAILDVDGRELATVGDVGPPDEVADAAHAARSAGRTMARGERWATAVTAAGDTLCLLVLRPTVPLAEGDLRTFERAAVVVALLLLSRRSAAEAESRVRGELLSELVSRPPGDAAGVATVRERALRLGVDFNQPHVLLVLHAPVEARARVIAWAANQAATHAGLAAYRDGSGVLMLPSADPGELARRLVRQLGPGLSGVVTIGAAGPVRSPGEVSTSFATARRCAAALIALGRRGAGAGPADLGYAGLLLGCDDEGIDGFVRSCMGAVLDYDARRGTALAHTLAAYFAAGASPARAAEALHVHVNTVAQRLDRLTTLLGAGWQRPERALELQLALRLHRLRGEASAQSTSRPSLIDKSGLV